MLEAWNKYKDKRARQAAQKPGGVKARTPENEKGKRRPEAPETSRSGRPKPPEIRKTPTRPAGRRNKPQPSNGGLPALRNAVGQYPNPRRRTDGSEAARQRRKIEWRKYLQCFQAVTVDGIPSMISIPRGGVSIFAFSN
jgi:hypothetical protein